MDEKDGELSLLAVKPREDISKGAYCVYCQQKTGEPHYLDCVMVRKRVRVKMSITYETDVPYNNTDEDILFWFNESTHCADNELDYIKEIAEVEGCICPRAEFELVKQLGSGQVYL